MKSKNNYKNNSKSVNTLKNNYYILPLILISSLLPIIMRLHEYNPRLSKYTWFWNSDKFADFFLFYKQIFLILISIIMLFILANYFIKKHQKFYIVTALAPIFIYAMMAILSTVFSKYSLFGYTGVYEQFESVFALLSYCVIVIYSFYFIKTEDNLCYFLKYFMISILILGILGLTQTFGHDFLATNFGKKLFISSKYWGSLDQFQFTIPKKMAYLTMYNPNYAGVYTALIIPILIVLLITCKNIKNIILYSLNLVIMLVCLFGTGSESGKISLLCCLLAIVLLFRKYIFNNKKIAYPLLGIFLVFMTSITMIKYDTIKSTLIDIFSFKPVHHALTNIKTEDSLIITYNNNDLVIRSFLDSDQIITYLSDQNNVSIPFNTDSSTGKVTIQDERYQNITITPVKYDEIICLDINIDGKDWYFSNQLGDSTFYYLNSMNRFDKIIKADSSLFTGYENIASGRGYIWSRTIPLLKNSLFLGTGADSFVFVFPHQDYLSSYQTGLAGALLTKPHSMYIQVWVQTGAISLLALLLFYGIYFVNCIRIFGKGRFENNYDKIGVAIFVGTISYMITSLANDSSITVAPIFWVLIGIGTAINHILLKESILPYKHSKNNKNPQR